MFTARTTPAEPYRWLAQYYDAIFAAQRSPIDGARETLLSRILPRVESACDLACGTGSTAISLARRGIRTYAVDLSPAMCHLARRKAVRAGVPIQVIEADMRSFRLPEQVDLITCESDALNHVPRCSDLAKVARAVARALKPGGHFFFDVNNALGFKRYWTGNMWIEKPGVVLVMRNAHTPQADRAWSDVDWFIREGRRWKRHRERVEEVCWDKEEMRRVFGNAGFDRLRNWDAARFYRGNRLVTPGCHTIYLARKAREK